MAKELTKEQELAREVSNAINNMSFDKKAFCEAMAREHRYLQNEFFLLCLDWLKTCAKEDYGHDGRNEYAHAISKELVKHFCY